MTLKRFWIMALVSLWGAGYHVQASSYEEGGSDYDPRSKTLCIYGKKGYLECFESTNVREVHLSRCQIDQWGDFRKFSQLKTLIIAMVTGKEPLILQDFPHLQRLEIYRTSLPQLIIEGVSELRHLQMKHFKGVFEMNLKTSLRLGKLMINAPQASGSLYASGDNLEYLELNLPEDSRTELTGVFSQLTRLKRTGESVFNCQEAELPNLYRRVWRLNNERAE